MAFKTPVLAYTGSIRPITLEKNGKKVIVGGENSYPFYAFEGEIPHVPKIAIQVPDFTPEDWAGACIETYRDVMGNPVAWAKKAQDVYKADVIFLWLKSTDPNGLNRSADEAAEPARQVLEAIDIPLIVWGSTNVEKDADVLRKVAMACSGKKVALGPVQEGNHKQIGAQALAYNHTVVASSPIDINLAKQLNILLGNLGVPPENILIDPTTGAIGYGIEYTYSVMERIRQAALTQQDEKLQFPMISNLADEVWKTKEAKLADDPLMGKGADRGITLEAMTAVTLLLAGADILVMRHPKAIESVRNYIADMAGVERPAQISIPVAETVTAPPEEAAALPVGAAEVALPVAATAGGATASPGSTAPPPSQPVSFFEGDLPPGMRLDIDIARIMESPVMVGSDHILTVVKISEAGAEQGGIVISQEAMDAFSAYYVARKQGFFPGPMPAVRIPVAEKLAVTPVEAKKEAPAKEKLVVTPVEAPAAKKVEEKKEEERPKVEYAKTWEVPEDKIGEYEYSLDKKEDFSGKKVELIGTSYEEGTPQEKGDWLKNFKNKEGMVQFLQTGLRHWYSPDQVEKMIIKKQEDEKNSVPVEKKVEEKKEEVPTIEYVKTWDEPADEIGNFDYSLEKKEDFSGKAVELIGGSYEGGKPMEKGDWRKKINAKKEMMNFLKTSLRYWYSAEVYGSEKRKTPA